jgi:exonuclease SbcD
MRLLHTSDWHLGRSLHRCDLRDAQAPTSTTWSTSCARSASTPCSSPATSSTGRCRRSTRWRSTTTRCSACATPAPGRRHERQPRLGEPAGVGAGSSTPPGVHVRTRPQDCGAPVLLSDEHGEVAVYGLPYLEPEAVRTLLPPDPGGSTEVPRGHAGVLGRAMACVRDDLSRRCARSVVLAHAWVTGGELSESERDIRVGGVGDVSASLFDGIDYTALGHLHGAQVLRPGLRYSGSPLAFSFSEAGHAKGSWLVELDAGGLRRVERVRAPVPRRLSSLTGALPDLLVDPALRRRRTTGCRSCSPTPSGRRTRWPACAPASPTSSSSTGSPRGGRRRAHLRRAGRRARRPVGRCRVRAPRPLRRLDLRRRRRRRGRAAPARPGARGRPARAVSA